MVPVNGYFINQTSEKSPPALLSYHETKTCDVLRKHDISNREIIIQVKLRSQRQEKQLAKLKNFDILFACKISFLNNIAFRCLVD